MSRQRDELKRKLMNLEREVEAYRGVGNIRKTSKINRMSMLSTPFKAINRDENQQRDDFKENVSMHTLGKMKSGRLAYLGTPFKSTKPKVEVTAQPDIEEVSFEVEEGPGGISFML